jgi:hypothetical protein
MPTSFLDDYLKSKVPGYTPGGLSTETVAFAAALDLRLTRSPSPVTTSTPCGLAARNVRPRTGA